MTRERVHTELADVVASAAMGHESARAAGRGLEVRFDG